MSVFLIVFNIILIAVLLLWGPLLGMGIYRLKKYGAKPGGIIMTVFGGIWGVGAVVVGGIALLVYLQFQAYSVPAFDPATHEGPLSKIKFPFSSEICLNVTDSKGNNLKIEGDGDFVELPVGEYNISFCSFEKKDKNGNSWTLRIYPQNLSSFKVSEGKFSDLDIGVPITTAIYAGKHGKNSFSLSINSKDKYGNKADLSFYSAGKPKFQILSMDDKILKEGSFEYG